MIRFFNTLTHRREEFQPILPQKVRVYSCGPTAHAVLHIGVLRRIVVADILRRYLEYRGHEVTHVMNITDLDDKTIAGSEAAKIPFRR